MLCCSDQCCAVDFCTNKAILSCASTCGAVLCHTMLRCAMLCHAVLCCAVPCHAVPGCAMQRCAMLNYPGNTPCDPVNAISSWDRNCLTSTGKFPASTRLRMHKGRGSKLCCAVLCCAVGCLVPNGPASLKLAWQDITKTEVCRMLALPVTSSTRMQPMLQMSASKLQPSPKMTSGAL